MLWGEVEEVVGPKVILVSGLMVSSFVLGTTEGVGAPAFQNTGGDLGSAAFKNDKDEGLGVEVMAGPE
jgi:hypothetical protein